MKYVCYLVNVLTSIKTYIVITLVCLEIKNELCISWLNSQVTVYECCDLAKILNLKN